MNTYLGKQPGYHPVVRLLYRLLWRRYGQQRQTLLTLREQASGPSVPQRKAAVQVRTLHIIRFYHIAPGENTLPRSIVNSKYSHRGGYSASSFERFNLPRNVVDLLVSTSNASLASSTWAKYSSTNKLINTIAEYYDMQLSFPFNFNTLILLLPTD